MLFADSNIPADTRIAVNKCVEHMRLPQSIMLSGGSEELRRKCAVELCLSVMCKNISHASPFPCGMCEGCRKAAAGTHPDIKDVLPTGDRKTISVDNIKQQVLETLYAAPNESENKIYIFGDADALSVQIQNALLKTVEEPPENVMFLFLCEKRESMLTTVISRLTEYALGDTLSANDRKNDEKVLLTARSIACALAKEDEYALMLKTAPMQKNRKLISKTAEKLIQIVRDALVENSGASLFSGCEEEAVLLSMKYSAVSLMKIKAAMDKIIDSADANANENLLLTQFSSSLAVIINERK